MHVVTAKKHETTKKGNFIKNNKKDNDVIFLCFISKDATLPKTCLENVLSSLQYCVQLNYGSASTKQQNRANTP